MIKKSKPGLALLGLFMAVSFAQMQSCGVAGNMESSSAAPGAAGIGEASSTTSALTAVSGVVASPGDKQNVIAWDEAAGAASYNIYWDTRPGVTSSRQNMRVGAIITGIKSAIYMHTCLNNGKTYYYKVSAVMADDRESPTNDSEVSSTPVYTECGQARSVFRTGACLPAGKNPPPPPTLAPPVCGNVVCNGVCCPAGQKCGLGGTCV